MNIQPRLNEIMTEIVAALTKTSADELRGVCNEILAVRRIFLTGAGRTGLVMKMLAMRLAQAGLNVHFVGDCTAPAIVAADLLIAASGGGNTASTLVFAEKAASVGARLAAITFNAQSPLAKIANTTLIIPLPTDATRPTKIGGSQILGSLFEQGLFFVTTLIVEEIAGQLGEDETRMFRRHANLE